MERVKLHFQEMIESLLVLGSKERKYLKLTADSLLILLALSMSFLFRFEWVIPHEYSLQLLYSLPIVLFTSISSFLLLGAYSDFWVYWSFRDLGRLILCHSVALAVYFVIDHVFAFLTVPLSIFTIYWFVSSLLLAGIRILWRNMILLRKSDPVIKKRLLIIGAGKAGDMLIAQIQSSPDMQYFIVGIIDDDPVIHNRSLRGVKILGDMDALSRIVYDYSVEELLIAIPSANSTQMRCIVEKCEKTHLPFRTVPGLKELVDGRVTFNRLRPVKIDDLLGREQSSMNVDRVSKLIQGRTVLVTGAAGSIGSELCRQVQKMSPEQLVILDKDENRMFYLNNELKNQGAVEPFVMNIRNRSKLERIFRLFKPDVVFNAAAYKHVPCMEWSPEEAIINNLESTVVLSEMAAEANVEKFIQISTDKAVHPTTIMGASKRLCELYILNYMKRGRKGFVSVRFGNVIGSQGSVFTVFDKQIKEGKPLTVTHPDMERFFMSIEEACKLVMEAGALGKGGCVFVLDMGEPIKIMDLAKQMIILSGLVPGEDIPIEISGLRPGEKLYEELWYKHEKPEKTANSKIFTSRNNGSLNHQFLPIIHDILIHAHRMKYKEMTTALQQLIPDYQPSLTSSLYSYKMPSSDESNQQLSVLEIG